MVLGCMHNQVEYLFTQPTITWISPTGTEVQSGGGSNPTFDPLTNHLIFTDLAIAISGTYTCRSVVNIPEAMIVDHVSEATVTITTKS